MQSINYTFILRITLALILLIHSIPGMFNNGINDFGNLYLNPIGFGSWGLPLAWIVKISHVVAALCFITQKYIKWASIVTIFVLVMGIVMVHFKEGWFVVGGGRNGVEFNVLLIAVLLSFIFPNGFARKED